MELIQNRQTEVEPGSISQTVTDFNTHTHKHTSIGLICTPQTSSTMDAAQTTVCLHLWQLCLQNSTHQTQRQCKALYIDKKHKERTK